MANEFNSLQNLWGFPHKTSRKRSHSELKREHERLARFHREHEKRKDEKRGARERSAEARRFERKYHRKENRHFEIERHRKRGEAKKLEIKHKHIGFNSLARKVAREYERKGYSKKAAMRFGKKTAGKVWGEQHRR